MLVLVLVLGLVVERGVVERERSAGSMAVMLAEMTAKGSVSVSESEAMPDWPFSRPCS